jgi:hypothetical protein
MTESALFKPIQENAELSDVSKRNYRNLLNALQNKADDVAVDVIILDPKKYVPMLKKWYPKPASLKSSFVALLALFRYNPSFKEKHAKVYDAWKKAFEDAKAAVEQRYEENAPSERQEEGYVPYEEIVRVRDSLPVGSVDRLLLDMYTHLKPMRCEYARIALYRGKVGAEPNYILLRGKQHGTLVIQQYKTKNTHGKQEFDLPPEIMTDLHKSLEEYPREWLFVNTKHEPYSRNLYVQWTMRVFQKLFGKPLSVALIRHSYINTLDFNTLTIKDKKAIATSMGHEISTQDRYRLIFTDKEAKCDCECTKHVAEKK